MVSLPSESARWSSGMIPASGAGGSEFDSRVGPIHFLPLFLFVENIISTPAPHACPSPHVRVKCVCEVCV